MGNLLSWADRAKAF